MQLYAIKHMRRMRGGSQSHLILASDENLYVVKFQNNPQHLRVLANEFLATLLAKAIGLTVPSCAVIEVHKSLIAEEPGLDMEKRSGRERCAFGPQFGSRFVGGLMPGQVTDVLPETMLSEVRNLNEFAGILAFDKWTSNQDGRQAVFSKTSRQRWYTATFIDQGYCFDAGEWEFKDAPLRGKYARSSVYAGIDGWESFQPWLGRIEAMTHQTVWEIAKTIPLEWYSSDISALEKLIERLVQRCARVRELIDDFRRTSPNTFPNWPTRVKRPLYSGRGPIPYWPKGIKRPPYAGRGPIAYWPTGPKKPRYVGPDSFRCGS